MKKTGILKLSMHSVGRYFEDRLGLDALTALYNDANIVPSTNKIRVVQRQTLHRYNAGKTGYDLPIRYQSFLKNLSKLYGL